MTTPTQPLPSPLPSPLPTVDTPASVADRTVQELIGATEKPVEAAIIAAEPVMATPIFINIWEGILNWVYGLISNTAGMLVGFVVIDIQKYLALRNAASALTTLRAAEASGDSHAITQANLAADAAAASAIHYVGIVKP